MHKFKRYRETFCDTNNVSYEFEAFVIVRHDDATGKDSPGVISMLKDKNIIEVLLLNEVSPESGDHHISRMVICADKKDALDEFNRMIHYAVDCADLVGTSPFFDRINYADTIDTRHTEKLLRHAKENGGMEEIELRAAEDLILLTYITEKHFIKNLSMENLASSTRLITTTRNVIVNE